MPFLKGASPQVVRLFKEVFNDPDVVSEQRRQEEVCFDIKFRSTFIT